MHPPPFLRRCTSAVDEGFGRRVKAVDEQDAMYVYLRHLYPSPLYSQPRYHALPYKISLIAVTPSVQQFPYWHIYAARVKHPKSLKNIRSSYIEIRCERICNLTQDPVVGEMATTSWHKDLWIICFFPTKRRSQKQVDSDGLLAVYCSLIAGTAPPTVPACLNRAYPYRQSSRSEVGMLRQSCCSSRNERKRAQKEDC